MNEAHDSKSPIAYTEEQRALLDSISRLTPAQRASMLVGIGGYRMSDPNIGSREGEQREQMKTFEGIKAEYPAGEVLQKLIAVRIRKDVLSDLLADVRQQRGSMIVRGDSTAVELAYKIGKVVELLNRIDEQLDNWLRE